MSLFLRLWWSSEVVNLLLRLSLLLLIVSPRLTHDLAESLFLHNSILTLHLALLLRLGGHLVRLFPRFFLSLQLLSIVPALTDDLVQLLI